MTGLEILRPPSDLSDNESDVPALIERHLVDLDTDSSMEYRHLARQYGWHEDSSDSSDDLSASSFGDGSEDGSEDDTSDLRTRVIPKWWFLIPWNV